MTKQWTVIVNGKPATAADRRDGQRISIVKIGMLVNAKTKAAAKAQAKALADEHGMQSPVAMVFDRCC